MNRYMEAVDWVNVFTLSTITALWLAVFFVATREYVTGVDERVYDLHLAVDELHQQQADMRAAIDGFAGPLSVLSEEGDRLECEVDNRGEWVSGYGCILQEIGEAP